MTLPGRSLRAFAARICDAETMERVIDPIVADLQWEHEDALRQGRVWQSRRLLLRAYAGFWRTLAWLALWRTVGFGRGVDIATVRRACVFSFAAFVSVTVASVMPSLTGVAPWGGSTMTRMLLSAYLIPQALLLSIPVGVAIGVLVACRGRLTTRRDVYSVLLVGAACACLSWLLMEWIVPDANQRFRELVYAQLPTESRVNPLERGVNELGLSRLGLRKDPIAVRHFHRLWAYCFATVPLALFALSLAVSIKRGGFALAGFVAACFAYTASMFILDGLAAESALPPMLAAWLPTLLLLIGAAALLVLRGFRLQAEGRGRVT
jgi:lipopolysaccharide export LptBFGC system permease protein LptF